MRTTFLLAALSAILFAIFPHRAAAAAGDLDPTFGTGGEVTTVIGSGDNGSSVIAQTDGKILVAGDSWTGTKHNFVLVRYYADGSLDTSFNGTGKVTTAIGSGYDYGKSVALQTDGKILVAGYSNYGSITGSDFALVRYNSNGSLDTSFNGTGKVTTDIGGGDDRGKSVALQTDGKILVAGYSWNQINSYFALVRYNADGSLDTSFNGTGKVTTASGTNYDYGGSVALQSDGKIVVAGTSVSGGSHHFTLLRYNANGSLDTSFNGTGNVITSVGVGPDFGNSVALQNDGKILVAGFSWNGSTYAFALVRYTVNGSLDASFNGTGMVTTSFGSSNAQGYSVALQNDGKIIVAGQSFTGSTYIFALVRYNASGSLDSSFNGAGMVTTAIGSSGFDTRNSIALQNDGKILIAGSSLTGSKNEFAVVRYLAATGPVPSITSISPNPVPASASQQTVTINGSNFVNTPTVTLTWTGQPNYTVPSAQVTYVSDSQVQMAITVSTTPDNWTVKVTNPDGQQSNTVGFQVLANLPNSPGYMEVQAFSDRVELGWTDNSTNETGFKIERRTGAGSYSQIATTGANSGNAAYYTDGTTSPRITYTYRVRAYNAYGDSGYTNEVTVTTPGGPPGVFTLSNDPPVWDASIPGPKVQLNWSASTDVGNYAVYRNGTVYQAGIAGTAYLNSANLTGGVTYTYFIRASNADGTTDSNTISVMMPTATPVLPSITAQPQSQTATAGDNVTFYVSANGTPSPTFQWRLNSVNIAGATGATLTINNAQLGNAGYYTVVVRNSAGQVTSAAANLTVLSNLNTVSPTLPTYTATPAEPGKDSLVFITHGRTESGTAAWEAQVQWLTTMKSLVKGNVASNWMVLEYEWETESQNPVFTVLSHAQKVGAHVGNEIVDLAQFTPNGTWEHIHFIAHSAGSELIEEASRIVKGKSPTTTIHTTFLDPFVGVTDVERQQYGANSDWSENYFSFSPDTLDGVGPFTFGSLLHAHNVEVTWLDPAKTLTPQYCSSQNSTPATLAPCSYAASSTHGWPISFYQNTIPPIPSDRLPGYESYGFSLSKEGGGWTNRGLYPVGNAAHVLAAQTGVPQSSNPVFTGSIYDFSSSPHPVGQTGLLQFNTSGFTATTGGTPFSPQSVAGDGSIQTNGSAPTAPVGAPAWTSVPVDVTSSVNFVRFDAQFTSAAGAMGLLTVYWNDVEIGQIDERDVLPGVQSYTLGIASAFFDRSNSLGFRLDQFSSVVSSISVTNVATGFGGLPNPPKLTIETVQGVSTPVLTLTGTMNFTYLMEMSDDLVTWVPMAAVTLDTGVGALLTDPSAPGFTKRFYRAVSP